MCRPLLKDHTLSSMSWSRGNGVQRRYYRFLGLFIFTCNGPSRAKPRLYRFYRGITAGLANTNDFIDDNELTYPFICSSIVSLIVLILPTLTLPLVREFSSTRQRKLCLDSLLHVERTFLIWYVFLFLCFYFTLCSEFHSMITSVVFRNNNNLKLNYYLLQQDTNVKHVKTTITSIPVSS